MLADVIASVVPCGFLQLLQSEKFPLLALLYKIIALFPLIHLLVSSTTNIFMAEFAELLVDLVNIVEEEQNHIERFEELRLQRIRLRDISNPFTLPPQYFIQYYRMTPETVMRLVELLEIRLRPERSTGIPVYLQILITLRFLSQGPFQKGLAQNLNHPISQSTASRCIRRVVEAILSLGDTYIQFPTTFQQRDRIQQRFRRTIRIPGIVGIVDGFLVTFKRSSQNEEAFFNYRVGSSMNVQIVVDSDYNILNVRVCPGSNNDRFVWLFSDAKEYMESLRRNRRILEEEGRYYILGDSGYTPSPTLLTPILNAEEGSPEAIYTSEHVGTRRYVEQTIGILTNVWMAIKRCRTLYYGPEMVTSFILACCILHNFRRRNGIFDEIPEQADNPAQNVNAQRNEDFQAGIIERQRIIHQFYRI